MFSSNKMMKIYEIKVKIFSIVFMSLNESKINRIKKDDKKIKTKSILNNFVYLVNLSEKINV